jgi:hypothetical protein
MRAIAADCDLFCGICEASNTMVERGGAKSAIAMGSRPNTMSGSPIALIFSEICRIRLYPDSTGILTS